MAGNWSRNSHYLALDDLPSGPVSPPSSYQQSFRDSLGTTEHGTPTPYDPGADVTDWRGSQTSFVKPVNLDLAPTVNESQTFLGADMATKTPVRHFGAMHDREVCSSKRLPVLWSFITYHLPAVAVTLVLFALYLAKQVWGPPGPTEDQLSVLQLAAKVHEIVVLISLSDILLHRVRYGLLGDDGVAMGFLLSPFHVASPEYLFSWEFWGTVLHSPTNRRFHRLTAVIIVLLTLIGVGTGPVSAIAMIPRLQWMEVSPNDQWYKDHVRSTEEIFYLKQDTYPMVLDTSTLPDQDGLCLNGFTNPGGEGCTTHDVTPLIQNFVSLKEMRQGDDQTKYNVTMSRDGTHTPYRPISVPIFTRAAFATGAMDFAAWELTRNYLVQGSNRDVLFQSHRISRNDMSHRGKWKQPAVTVTCGQGGLREDNEDYIDFYWPDDPSYEGDLLKNGEIVSLSIDETFESSWIPLDDEDSSVAEVFYLDLNLKDQVSVELSAALLFANNTMENPKLEDNMELCLIQAGWLEADIWADTRLPTGAQSDFGIPKGKDFERLNEHVNKEGPIMMKGEWFGVLGAENDYARDEPRPNTDYVDLHRYAVIDGWVLPSLPARPDPSRIPQILSKLLAVYVTDAMTLMMGYERVDEDEENDSEFPVEARNIIQTSVHQHLWAYTLDDSKSRPAAFAILLFHVLIVLVHHAVILLGPKPWHGSGWGNLEELIALALRSRVPEANEHPTEIIHEGDPEQLGSRKQGSEPRNIPIVIRETGGEGGLEIMVASRKVTRAASAVDLGRYSTVKRVKTGMKYSL